MIEARCKMRGTLLSLWLAALAALASPKDVERMYDTYANVAPEAAYSCARRAHVHTRTIQLETQRRGKAKPGGLRKFRQEVPLGVARRGGSRARARNVPGAS